MQQLLDMQEKKELAVFGVEGVRAPLRLCSNVHGSRTVLDTTYRRSTHRAHTHEETRGQDGRYRFDLAALIRLWLLLQTGRASAS